MAKKSTLFVMVLILSMFLSFSCSKREERTLAPEYANLRYDFSFVVVQGVWNYEKFPPSLNLNADCNYNWIGGPANELYVVRLNEPEIITWRIATPGMNGIPSPWQHDSFHVHFEEYRPLPGVVRTASLDRHLQRDMVYMATVRRLNGQTAQRIFTFYAGATVYGKVVK